MKTVVNKRRTFGAGLAAIAVTAFAIAPAAMAAEESGDVEVVNTETVQVYVGPDGEVESQRVYEQLSFTGQGSVAVSNPVEQDGLRNLDGFGGVSAEDGVQDVELEVDGYERLRSVSDFTGELPLEFDITYLLDGEEVEPGDVVGADGALEVLYTVRNVTAQPQEVSFPDGKGGTMTETVEVPIPIVGSMTTVVPSSFTDVTSEQANIAGDGKGGTKLSFTMTLFPPLGSDEMEFSYQAQISDAVIPSTQVTALPVNPLEVPTFKTAGDSYQAGADTGLELADGATEIDENLLKLRDGAGDLLAGLVQLSDGSDELAAGLAGEAAPGSQQLAAGAVELNNGLGLLDAGAGELSLGAAAQPRRGHRGTPLPAAEAEDGLSGSVTVWPALRRRGAAQGARRRQAAQGRCRRDRHQGRKRRRRRHPALGHQPAGHQAPGRRGPARPRSWEGCSCSGATAQTETPGLVAAKGGVDQVKTGLDSALAPANGAGNPVEPRRARARSRGRQDQLLRHPRGRGAVQRTLDQLIAGVGTSRTT